MRLYHATTRDRLAHIRQEGLLVSKADPATSLKAIWLHTSSHSAWAVVHTIRKHKTSLDQIVVVEVFIARRSLRRFRTGLWYTVEDIKASALEKDYPGERYGASVGIARKENHGDLL